MKTATIPSLRVEPELRESLEALLKKDETLSSFVESAIRQSVRRRQLDAEFHARGLAAMAQWREDGVGFSAEEVLAELQTKLDTAKAERARRRSSK